MSVECMALLGVQLRDDLSPSRKTAVRTSAITMRPGWLAQAAFFCAPHAHGFRVCGKTLVAGRGSPQRLKPPLILLHLRRG